MKPTQLLLIEDEQSIADALIFALEAENYQVHWCALGTDALALLESQPVDFILLDVGLPDINGFDLCKKIKAMDDYPIMFLTARQEEVDKLIGLEIGGDDYMTKPFSLREVASRIRVIMKRYQKGREQTPTSALPTQQNCYVDDARKCIYYYNTALELTRYEFRLFQTLIENPNRVFSREVLMNQVWEEPERSFERAVDTHIKTLRAKLRQVNSDKSPIKTHHGLGYSFSDNEVAE